LFAVKRFLIRASGSFAIAALPLVMIGLVWRLAAAALILAPGALLSVLMLPLLEGVVRLLGGPGSKGPESIAYIFAVPAMGILFWWAIAFSLWPFLWPRPKAEDAAGEA